MNLDTTSPRQHTQRSTSVRKLGPTLAFLESQLAEKQLAYKQVAERLESYQSCRVSSLARNERARADIEDQIRALARRRRKAAGAVHAVVVFLDRMLRLQPIPRPCTRPRRLARTRQRARRTRVFRAGGSSKKTSTGDPDSSDGDPPGDRAELRAAAVAAPPIRLSIRGAA